MHAEKNKIIMNIFILYKHWNNSNYFNNNNNRSIFDSSLNELKNKLNSIYFLVMKSVVFADNYWTVCYERCVECWHINEF